MHNEHVSATYSITHTFVQHPYRFHEVLTLNWKWLRSVSKGVGKPETFMVSILIVCGIKNRIVSFEIVKSKSGSANYQWEGLASVSSFDKLYHKLYAELYCDAKCLQDSE